MSRNIWTTSRGTQSPCARCIHTYTMFQYNVQPRELWFIDMYMYMYIVIYMYMYICGCIYVLCVHTSSTYMYLYMLYMYMYMLVHPPRKPVYQVETLPLLCLGRFELRHLSCLSSPVARATHTKSHPSQITFQRKELRQDLYCLSCVSEP